MRPNFVTSPCLSSRAGFSRGDDKHSTSRAQTELGNGWALAGSTPGVWEDGDFGAERVWEKRWIRRDPGTRPCPSPRDLGFGAGPAAPCTFACPSPSRCILKSHHLNQLVLPAPRFLGWHRGTARSTRTPRALGEQHPRPPLTWWHLCQVLSLLPSAPQCSQSPLDGDPSPGAGSEISWGLVGTSGDCHLRATPAGEIKAQPLVFLGATTRNSLARAQRGSLSTALNPQIPVCSARSGSKAPGAPGDADRPRQRQIKAFDGRLASMKNQIPALEPPP